MKTLIRIFTHQPLAYGVLFVIILSVLSYWLGVIGFFLLILGFVLSVITLIRKPSNMKLNYKIKKGWSHSIHRIAFHFGDRKMRGQFYFPTDFYYEDTPGKEGQINKIVGLGWGFHHNNSLRIGYEYKNGSIVLYSYVYHNGERSWYPMMTVAPGSRVEYELGLDDYNHPCINLKERYGLEKESNWTQNRMAFDAEFGFFLFPYHKKASHDIIIELQYYGKK